MFNFFVKMFKRTTEAINYARLKRLARSLSLSKARTISGKPAWRQTGGTEYEKKNEA